MLNLQSVLAVGRFLLFLVVYSFRLPISYSYQPHGNSLNF